MNEEIREDIAHALIRLVAWFESTSIYQQFTSYPHQKNLSYTTHAWRNAKESVKLGFLSIRLWIHAFFPFLFQSVDRSAPQDPEEQKEQKEDQRLKTE